MTLREDLADWRDWDEAAAAYGRALGLFDGVTDRQVSRVLMSNNPLGDGLHAGMTALVAAGVVEHRDDPDEQYRWAFAGVSTPGDDADLDPTDMVLEMPTDLPPAPAPAADEAAADGLSGLAADIARRGFAVGDVAPAPFGGLPGGTDQDEDDDEDDQPRGLRRWLRRG